MVGNASDTPDPTPPGVFHVGQLVTIVYDLPKEFPEYNGANCEGFRRGSVVRIGQSFPPLTTISDFKSKETVIAQFYTYQIIYEEVRNVEGWRICDLATALEKNIAKRLDASERSMRPGISVKNIADGSAEYYVHKGCLEYITVNRGGMDDDGVALPHARLKEPLSAGRDLNFLLPKNTRVVVHHESYSVHNLGQRTTNGMNRRIQFVCREQQKHVHKHKSIFTVPGFMLQAR